MEMFYILIVVMVTWINLLVLNSQNTELKIFFKFNFILSKNK